MEERSMTSEEQLTDLKNQVQELKEQIVELKARMSNDWRAFQNLFGVKFIQQGNNLTLMIMIPKKDQGAPGAFSDLWQKVNALWNQYGGSILVPDGDIQ